MQIPKVLVLGATGRIGMILRKCWSQNGTGGRVLWQARRKPNGPGAGRPDWAVLDPLSQPGALARAAEDCTVVLCLSGVIPSRGDGAAKLSDNAALAEAAIRAGATVGARVFLASSAGVYGTRSGLLDENTPLAPVSAYGRAKAEMEARGAALGARLGVPVTCLRIGNIAGIDAILGGWKPGFRLDQFRDGSTPRRSYIGAATLARVLGDLMRADTLPAALNVAAPGTVEMSALLEAAGLPWTPRPAPETAIAEVRLSTDVLELFTILPSLTSAESLVAEWVAQKELAE